MHLCGECFEKDRPVSLPFPKLAEAQEASRRVQQHRQDPPRCEGCGKPATTHQAVRSGAALTVRHWCEKCAVAEIAERPLLPDPTRFPPAQQLLDWWHAFVLQNGRHPTREEFHRELGDIGTDGSEGPEQA